MRHFKSWYDKRYRKKHHKEILIKEAAYREANRVQIREGKKQFYAKHRAKIIMETNKWKISHRERHKFLQLRSNLKRRHGITPEQLDEMLTAQQGRCAVCNRNIILHIDHNHITGKIRGLLCIKCNTTLGWYDMYRQQYEQYLAKEKTF
jgi:hypothetical protein